MGITFNADEIFEMAEQIERNGAKFYRKAAESMSDESVASLFIEFASMEVEHEKTFANMRAELVGKENESMAFDPDHQAALYLRAVANGHVFDIKTDPASNLTGSESAHDILVIHRFYLDNVSTQNSQLIGAKWPCKNMCQIKNT